MMDSDRENFGIDDEKFQLILVSLITNCLTNDGMLNVVIDSEVQKRLGEDAWDREAADLGRTRASIIISGLEGVIDTIALLAANNFDPDAAEAALGDLDSFEVPDDLSGLDDLD